jgi:pyruvate formate lyase activating enzyme
VQPEDVRFIEMFPDAVVENVREAGCRSIAYTYSEATTFYKYMLDTSRLAREAGVKNVWVSNGYMNQPPFLELCKTLDAANIDIKNFSEDIYSRLNAGRLKPVLRTLITLKEKGIWFEITALIVPTYTDNMEMIKRMCEWILENLRPDYPLHFSRFPPVQVDTSSSNLHSVSGKCEEKSHENGNSLCLCRQRATGGLKSHILPILQK